LRNCGHRFSENLNLCRYAEVILWGSSCLLFDWFV
jgi:hypothetical protein